MIFQMMYISTAAKLMTDAELVEILGRARQANANRGVTGMLVYLDGTFIQVLEGEEQSVRALFQHIRRDPRHQDCHVLLENTCSEREFADWTMGFRSLSGLQSESLPGFADLVQARQNNTPSEGVVSLRAMLLHLAEANRGAFK